MDFSFDLLIVLALVFLVCGGLIAWKIGIRNLPAFLKTKDGKGVAKGVILAPLIIVAVALLMFLAPSKSHAEAKPLDLSIPGTFFNDASVFMGIDRTKRISPQCHSGGHDDRSTSNMGFRVNVWQSPSKNVRFNLMYTHHSCALNPDRNSYDAIGAQVEWFIWNRY